MVTSFRIRVPRAPFTTIKVTLVRRVVRSGRRYMITLPEEIGRQLHGQLVMLDIIPLEPSKQNHNVNQGGG